MRWLKLFILGICLGFAAPSHADNSDISLSLMVGEAYTFGGVRLSLWSFDLTVNPAMISGGTRVWKNGHYAGFGLGIGESNRNLGWYGSLGHEWRFFKVLGLFAEGSGHMTVKGNSQAVFALGVSIGW